MQLLGKPLQKRTRQCDEIAAPRRTKSKNRGSEPHAPVRCRCNDKLFGFGRRDNALHRGPREIHLLRDLAEAKPGIFLLECAQNGGRTGDHLHPPFGGDDVGVHRKRRCSGGPMPPCMSVQVSPKYGTDKSKNRPSNSRLEGDGDVMVRKIALEEHFLDPATEPYWRPTMVDVAPARTAQLYASLADFGEQRLKMMDKHGIARAVLAIAGPGVQAERDAAKAVQAARASNDFLAKEVQKRPDRYSGFAHLAMQDAKAAADELERCVRELTFCSAMINGHTSGKYLDDRSYDPFWERAAALGAPIYPPPADLVAPLPVLAGYNVLVRPMWGWGVETGSHALRIISGGVFHRYPNAKLTLSP